ncbi:rare lipoprotein A [Azomonas agilis]|uniref:Endolytic peptidoglycan transglycosylase RlpA n=1 Tax=Azomonas agilis TaxID=116849 RepID=A0A562I0K3_9GAMM|nr:septal ring lytic transglycosylase RlpA family protein [Azomonas agilis]TWH64579.1 rare lipoprotein A [Azomonas agilis]
MKAIRRACYAATSLLGGVLMLLVGCSSDQPAKPQTTANSVGSGSYARPHRDGAPWWDVDVSQIPDAVPMPHSGPVKANPYTVLGQTYYPMPNAHSYNETGTASWYGTKFHKQATANGEEYDLYGMTAAHKTLPLPCYVRVTNLENGKSVILRVNDRGPFYSDRIIDLSFAAARKLGYADRGTARVKVEGIDPVRWWAAKGQPVPSTPLVLAKTSTPVASKVSAAAPVQVVTQPLEIYTPPPQQHAAPLSPRELSQTAQTPNALSGGVFLQVGAFANPDAAQLLKDRLSGMVTAPVFISSVVHREQVLHRVRLGPIDSASEAAQVEQNVRLARLGDPKRVMPD